MADPYRWTDPNEPREDRYSDRQWERDRQSRIARQDDERRWTEPRLHSHHAHHPMDWRSPEERGYDRYLEEHRDENRGWRAAGSGGPSYGGNPYAGDRYTAYGDARRSRGGSDYYDRYAAGYTPHDSVRDEERSWMDRAADEVQSWFGDREAERRREHDHLMEGQHRGRGPKGYKRADERVRDDVSDRLADDSWLDASDIEVKVENGEVTLNGTVVCRPDKRRAEALAERVSGVGHVQNNLRIAGRLAEHPDEIAKMTPLD